MPTEAGNILDSLKAHAPSASLQLLKMVRDIDWKSDSNSTTETYCEIILFLNANIIFRSFEKDEKDKMIFKDIFQKIYERILESDFLLNSTEFKEYFLKFESYISEF
jgi:hypothetical protein